MPLLWEWVCWLTCGIAHASKIDGVSSIYNGVWTWMFVRTLKKETRESFKFMRQGKRGKKRRSWKKRGVAALYHGSIVWFERAEHVSWKWIMRNEVKEEKFKCWKNVKKKPKQKKHESFKDVAAVLSRYIWCRCIREVSKVSTTRYVTRHYLCGMWYVTTCLPTQHESPKALELFIIYYHYPR